ncbi:MAG: nucleotide sugar dehydrogenase [Hyphomicrobiaceae bacterium]
MRPLSIDSICIGVIGLGYVGLPLAAYMARQFEVIGFDIDTARITALEAGCDHTNEVSPDELAAAKGLSFTSNTEDLAKANFYIVTVPTPIDQSKRPDLTALEKASATVGKVIAKGDVVVFESTVFPGATEEICVPIIEQMSGLVFNQDFFAGYSPERINPGDRQHRLPDILKVTSGSTPEAAALIDAVYARIVTAGTFPTSSIRVAEAAKVIENIQRDVNIALINELAQLFRRMHLDTDEVLAAAGSKWNFHAYKPGLVGGHCIGVDPYYLTHKAQSIGFHPEMILAGRRISDSMPDWVARDIVMTMLRKRVAVGEARVLVLGFTFKENVPDIRNTKVADLARALAEFTANVTIFDPHADPAEVAAEYDLALTNTLPAETFDCLVLAVAHDAIRSLPSATLEALRKPDGPSVIYDLKWILPTGNVDGRL